MGNFNRDSRGGGRGGFGGGRGGFGGGRGGFGGGRGFDRGGDRGDRPMHQAICSNCGKECQVPFRPTTGKPVYCSDCFEKMGNRSDDRQSSDRPRFDDRKPSFDQSKAQLDALNAKLDKILSILAPQTVAPEISTPTAKEVKKEEKAPKAKKTSKKKASEETETKEEVKE